MTFAEKTISILQEYCDKECGGNIRATQVSLGLDPDKAVIYRWLAVKDSDYNKQTHMPRVDTIGPLLDKIGAVLVGPYDEYPSIELAQAKAKIRQLEQEIAHLQQYKDKWLRILEMC